MLLIVLVLFGLSDAFYANFTYAPNKVVKGETYEVTWTGDTVTHMAVAEHEFV